jgi:hypothetical protein
VRGVRRLPLVVAERRQAPRLAARLDLTRAAVVRRA